MPDSIQTTKTVFTVGQFLDWQKQGTLDLSPIFQRRQVWKRPAKSQLIDSIFRGYPLPIVLLRQVQDMKKLSMKMEVVDGQQRLRTLLAYIDSSCLPDFEESRDTVVVQRTHNKEFSGKPFLRLPTDIKQQLLTYEISTHVFPPTTGDQLVYRIFARLNSTGLSLNEQEIRNSEYHGAFKTLVYELAFENLDYWRKWQVFSNDAISRMQEAEAVSEYILAMLNGVTSKSQKRISDIYAAYEEEFPHSESIQQRFNNTVSAIHDSVGDLISQSAFNRAALFYSLFAALYHHRYGLGSPLTRTRAKSQELTQGY